MLQRQACEPYGATAGSQFHYLGLIIWNLMKPICVKAYKDFPCFYIRNDAMSRHVRDFPKEYQMSAFLNSTPFFSGICFVLNQGILSQRFCFLTFFIIILLSERLMEIRCLL